MGEKPSTCLKLFGSWASSYTHRVQLALKLKSLEFEYIEEDLANKSPSLLLHNPIYKKVPVLIHNYHAVPESLIILQYIDETWPSACPLMPSDPYEKSLFRFWSLFVDDKLGPVVGTVFATTGEIQKAAVEQVHEKLIETEIRISCFTFGIALFLIDRFMVYLGLCSDTRPHIMYDVFICMYICVAVLYFMYGSLSC